MVTVFFLLMCLAINNLTDILVHVDLLNGIRTWFQNKFPRLGKIVICKYCQSFWLSGIGTFFFLFLGKSIDVVTCLIWIALWLSAHRIIQIIDIFCDIAYEYHERFMQRASLPINANVFMTLENSEKATISMDGVISTEKGSSDKEVITDIHPQGQLPNELP